jgi:aspartyl-tRNA(Asn)/glutamyl-tRNA(Gln) amidotransferase subunit C
MKVDESLILRLEKLARLELSETERRTFQGDLDNILEMVEKLSEIDTTNVEPLRHVIDTVKPWREDEIHQPISKTDALKNAPNHDGNHFKVRKVIEK